MNFVIKPADFLSHEEYIAKVGGEFHLIASEFEQETTPRLGFLSEIRDTLMELDPLFGIRMNYGWRPWIATNGDVKLFDGTVLFNDPASRLQVGENAKIEWRP